MNFNRGMAVSSFAGGTARADPEGVGGAGGPDPHGISQVIWVSTGNKKLDPPPPLLEKVGPPPLGKCWTPSGTLKNDRFL